ncbi:MAG: glycerol-3-phosphate dehydrogenase [Gammaproteobacteria bacterium]|nr:glycerol-3-phosphate dehydrogenase [Gammaproteobacteria bacterium]
MDTYDLAVIGGGINGVGIAADAAGRGLRVALFEQSDLGGATSTASTKLVHGGLRYLETGEYLLVRKALKESQLLLELAPHLIEPIDIHLPYQKHLRPWWMIRAGLFLYNHLAARPSYPAARALKFGSNSPLREELTHGFSFSDGQVDDARLVILNACQARQFGADIFVRHRCSKLDEEGDDWVLGVEDTTTGAAAQFRARVVVNAGGPWVSDLFQNATGKPAKRQVKMVKGSHIVVPAAYPGKQAYMLQNEDGRIAFVIPYLGQFTMVGTTEAEFSGDPADAEISPQEIDYLLEIYNSYLAHPIERKDIVYTWSGVRPLIDNRETTATKTSRDYQLVFENSRLPLLSVYGGKLTTYRLLAEQAVDKLAEFYAELPASRTAGDCLPGGDFTDRQQLEDEIAQRFPWLPAQIIERWVVSYGSLAYELLADCNEITDLGMQFGYGLTQREVDYQIDREWARTVDDILWRRTKLGILFGDSEKQELENYLASRIRAKDENKNKAVADL